MKKIALISSYCDTSTKIDVLVKNINIVKSLGIDVILISPLHLPENVTSLCDYYFQTRDNPVLKWPFRAMCMWRICEIDGLSHKMSRTYEDYGWAGLFQVKQISEIALSLEYDQFFHMIYDLKFDEIVMDGFKSDRTKSIYPSKRETTIWKAGLHFMIFDRRNLRRFISNINLDSYVSLSQADAFSWLINLHSVFPYDFENNPVEDEIFYYSDRDFFNYSPITEIPFFIIKDDETLDDIKILLHNPDDFNRIKIMVNGLEIHSGFPSSGIIDLGFNKNNLSQVSVIFENNYYDISNIIMEVDHNTLSPV